MGAKLWRKSSDGPDWTDIETMMRGLRAVHGGEIELTFSPRGTGFSGGLQVIAALHSDVLPNTELPECVICQEPYPCPDCASVEGHAFALLYQLDGAIGKAYRQRGLFEEHSSPG